MKQEQTFYQLDFLGVPEQEEGGKVSVCVRCKTEEGEVRAWLFTFRDWYKAMTFREVVIMHDGLYR